jgi:1-acyl-sn-glycerol-3-phosphate acyltransferase
VESGLSTKSDVKPNTSKSAEEFKDIYPAATGQLEPTAEELSVLSPFERFAFRLARLMNRGAWKRFWTFCQKTIGAGWIHLSTYNIMNVYGLENVEAASHDRPIVLVANHRSFFDMYAVSTVLFRNTKWRKQLFFPVRGRFFYQSPIGVFVNLVMGWFSMYPPFFATGDHPIPEKRVFDKFSFRVLSELARVGPGNIIGFHPEGTRNKSADPYSFLRAQPGVGKLVMDAKPQVIPVFIAGLCNDLSKQIARNWNREEVIRIYFGPCVDLTEELAKPDRLRSHKEIADLLMLKISELAERDRLAVEARKS